MRMTYVYILVGDGWIYPGRHRDPSKRYEEHIAGYRCKTTALYIRADKTPPIMVLMPGYEFDLDNPPEPNGELRLWLEIQNGKHIPKGHKFIGTVYPYYDKEDLARGQAKGLITNRKNGFPALQAGLITNRKRGFPELRTPISFEVRSRASKQGIETQRENKTGFFDEKVRAKAFKAQRITNLRNGYPGLRKGRQKQVDNKIGMFSPEERSKTAERGRNGDFARGRGLHFRWHANRGIVKSSCEFCQASI